MLCQIQIHVLSADIIIVFYVQPMYSLFCHPTLNLSKWGTANSNKALCTDVRCPVLLQASPLLQSSLCRWWWHRAPLPGYPVKSARSPLQSSLGSSIGSRYLSPLKGTTLCCLQHNSQVFIVAHLALIHDPTIFQLKTNQIISIGSTVM